MNSENDDDFGDALWIELCGMNSDLTPRVADMSPLIRALRGTLFLASHALRLGRRDMAAVLRELADELHKDDDE